MDSRSPHGAELLVDRPSEATGILNTHFEAPPLTNDMPASSTPLEMSRLEPSPRSSSPQQSKAIGSLQEHGNGSEDNRNPGTSTSAISATSAPPAEPSILPSGENTTSITTPTGAPLTSQSTNPAIGPSSDQPTPIPKEADSTGPTLVITLLLPTGARHPYRMDEKYLKKRNVNVPNNNPVHMSVYTLKELIWREWREEWESRPSSPSSIRLIHFGKLLDDKFSLVDAKFKNDTPNVVHMTVKPQDIVDEEDAKLAKQGGRDREGNERSPGCRCVLM